MEKERAFDTEHTPAYLGLMDLVRTDFGLLGLDMFSINYGAAGSVTISKPQNTWVQNFRQTIDLWKGRYVNGADLNVDVNRFFGTTLKHMDVFRNAEVRDLVAHKAAAAYYYRVKEESRPKPWFRKEGEYW